MVAKSCSRTGLLGWILGGCIACGGLQTVVHAQEGELAESSLSVVPADVAFYSTSLNMRESVDRLMQSSFVERLRGVPYVVELEAELTRQWENPEEEQVAQAKAFIEGPTATKLFDLVGDMFGNEFFVYGGADWCDAIEGIMAMQGEVTGLSDAEPEEVVEYLMSLTKEDIADIRVPTTVMGFKLTDDENARLQLDALEGILRLGLGSIDELKPVMSRLRRSDFPTGQSLSMTLEPKMIPPVDMPEDQQEVFEHMMELMEDRKLSIEIGVNGGTMLIVISEQPGVLKAFGAPAESLLNHEALEPLREQAPTSLRSVSYASEGWRASQWSANMGQYFQNLVAQFSMAVSQEGELVEAQEEWLEALADDAAELDAQLVQMAPEFGPMLSWAYSTDAGMEGYVYDWNANQVMENAEPLEIVDNAGTEPLSVLAANAQEMVYAEQLIMTLLEKAPEHLVRFVEAAEQDEDEKAKVLTAIERGIPMLAKAYAIYREQISPAMSNQAIIAISAGWEVTELPDMPPPPQPLPLPELAIASKLDDREMFIQGCSDLYDVMDEFVDLVRELDPSSVPPNYTIPRPDEEALSTGTRYFYSALAEQFPIEGFEPQVMVGDDVVIIGYSSRQVDAMATGTAPDWNIPWHDAGDPVAAVSYTSLAGYIRAVRPWAEFALMMSGNDLDDPVAEGEGPIPTGRDLLQLWDTLTCLGQVTGTTVVDEDGVTVGRWIWQMDE